MTRLLGLGLLVALTACGNRSSTRFDFPDLDSDLGVKVKTYVSLGSAPGEELTECFGVAEVDACIFYKNPVAQNGGAFTPDFSTQTNLNDLQTYGVTLAGRDGSGFLQNDSFIVYANGSDLVVGDEGELLEGSVTSVSGQRVVANGDGQYHYRYSNCSGGSCTADTRHRLGQVMTYYWLTRLHDLLIERTGVFYATQEALLVDTHVENYNNAAFSSPAALLFGVYPDAGPDGNNESSMDAGVVAHEYGHADLYFANGGNFGSPDDESNDLFRAMNEGQADYHHAILFEDSTALGEVIAPPTGIDYRNVDTNEDLTLSDALTERDDDGRILIHRVGAVYAAAWWSVRKGADNPVDVDRLFMEHLGLLKPGDDLADALGKILSADLVLFGQAHTEAFEAEWDRRGMPKPE